MGAVGGDRPALDQLEREVGPAVRRHPAVEQPRDAGVLEPGEDLALAAEAGERHRCRQVAPHQLDRGALHELPVGALGEEDLAHPAFADLLDETPGTDPRPGLASVGGGERPRQQSAGALGERRGEEGAGLGVGREQLLDLGAQRRVARAGPVEERGARLRRQVQRLVEDRLERAPALGVEGAHPPPSSR